MVSRLSPKPLSIAPEALDALAAAHLARESDRITIRAALRVSRFPAIASRSITCRWRFGKALDRRRGACAPPAEKVPSWILRQQMELKMILRRFGQSRRQSRAGRRNTLDLAFAADPPHEAPGSMTSNRSVGECYLASSRSSAYVLFNE